MRESSVRLCLRTILGWEGSLQEVVASGGSTVLLGMLHAMETGIISSNCLDLRLMCVFTFFYNYVNSPPV